MSKQNFGKLFSTIILLTLLVVGGAMVFGQYSILSMGQIKNLNADNSLLDLITFSKNNQEEAKTEKWNGLEMTKEYNAKTKVPIVMYHSYANFQSIPLNDTNPELSRGNRTPPEVFEKQVKILKARGITTISFKDLEDYKNGKIQIPKSSIILTFDDGWSDNFSAYKDALKLGVMASFAIVGSFVDKPDRLSTSQIKEMSDNGMEIISHSMSHKALSKLNLVDLRYELVNSKELLEKITGKAVNTIVYPAGDYSQTVIEESVKAGYTFGRTTELFVDTSDLNKPFQLPQMRSQCSRKSGIRDGDCDNLGNSYFAT